MADPKPLSAEEVLERVPQRPPFRFIDEILELDADHIVASYRFREDADFYRGHFPGNPITPGVILLETMAQAGVVALGLYLASAELAPEEMEKLTTVFTDASVDFSDSVLPGERVITTGTPVFFRRRKLQSQVEMKREDGTTVCSGVISGMGIMR
ncbi:MAG: beta-hydroxyacyl-ACP dehydratase [Myxococcota bacterium]